MEYIYFLHVLGHLLEAGLKISLKEKILFERRGFRKMKARDVCAALDKLHFLLASLSRKGKELCELESLDYSSCRGVTKIEAVFQDCSPYSWTIHLKKRILLTCKKHVIGSNVESKGYMWTTNDKSTYET